MPDGEEQPPCHGWPAFWHVPARQAGFAVQSRDCIGAVRALHFAGSAPGRAIKLAGGRVDSRAMAIDVAVVLALFAFAWLGAHRGGPESGVRFVGLGLAYGGAYLAGSLAGGSLARAFGVAPWIGLAGAGLLGFLGAQALVELAARKLRESAEDRSDLSRVAGAALGIARGGLLLTPFLFLASFSESMRSLNPAAALPNLSGARATAMGQAVAGAAAKQIAANGEGAARMTAKLVAAPGESVAALSAIAADPRMRVLQADAGFWSDLEGGDVAAALARPTFDELARDADLRMQLASVGVIDESSALDANRFRAEMATVMAELAPRLARIKADPAFQALLADEALRERVRAGDTFALLSDPRLQQLLANAGS
jgi:hypothetical protein